MSTYPLLSSPRAILTNYFKELTSSNIVAVEDWPERELVGPHLTNLASYRESFAGVLIKLVRPHPNIVASVLMSRTNSSASYLC
jgi:hypothetical protein